VTIQVNYDKLLLKVIDLGGCKQHTESHPFFEQNSYIGNPTLCNTWTLILLLSRSIL